jgi:hypothetical protein
MFYAILYMSCQGAICNPVFAEPVESPKKCLEMVAALPPRKDMKAVCIPVIK